MCVRECACVCVSVYTCVAMACCDLQKTTLGSWPLPPPWSMAFLVALAAALSSWLACQQPLTCAPVFTSRQAVGAEVTDAQH